MSKKKVRKDMWVDSDGSDFDVKSIGDKFDEWYGFDCFRITISDIEALKAGKVLYTNNGEYATLIMLKEAKE